MNDLPGITIIFGSLLAMLYAPLVFIPDHAKKWIKAFPRNKWAAWILTAIDLAWVGWLLSDTYLGRFEGLKPSLYVLVPLAFVLVVVFVNELLAPRALGGLLLLVPMILLDAARWHESGFRYIIIVVAYIMVIKGIFLTFSPYLFRKGAGRWLGSEKACRRWGAAGMCMSIFILLLGFFVF